MPDSPARPPTGRPCRTTIHRSAGIGIDRMAPRDAGIGRPGVVQIRRHRAWLAGPVRIGSRRSLFRASTRCPAARPSASAAAALDAAVVRRRPAAFASASSSMSRITTRSSRAQFGVSEGNTHRDHVRVQTDVSANAQFGFSGGVEWLGERGGSTFITSGPSPSKRRSSAACSASSARPAGTRAIARPSRPASAANASRRDALPGDPLAFQPRPAFPEETINSVNPKLAGLVRCSSRRKRDAAARLVRHRHSSARCVRNRLHRQFGAETGAQQERRGRRLADARRSGAVQLDCDGVLQLGTPT